MILKLGLNRTALEDYLRVVSMIEKQFVLLYGILGKSEAGLGLLGDQTF
jgi:hypothetical protein